ncbi:hypothetical protein [Desulfomarina sp.]
MKQNTLLTFLSLLLVIVYLLVWRIGPTQYIDPARFLPENTLLYLEQDNFSGFLENVEHSRLGKALKSIHFTDVGKSLDLQESEMKMLETIDSALKKGSDNLLLKELFNHKVVFALCEPVDSGIHDSMSFFRQNSVIIARPGHPAGLLQKIAEYIADSRDNVIIATRQYGDHFIKRITAGGETFSTVVLNGYFLAGFSEKLLRKCIDIYDGELPSLSENTEYRTLRTQYDNTEQFAYFSVQHTRELLLRHLESCDFAGKDVFRKEVVSTQGFISAVYGAQRDAAFISDRIIVTFNPEMVSKIVEDQTTTEPSVCDTIQFSPENPLLFYWTNTINFKLLYRLYGEHLFTHDEKLIRFSETINELTGRSIVEFIDFFGHEISYILMKNDAEDFLALPYGVMIFKIARPEELKKMLKSIVQRYDIPMERHLYGSGAYYSWTISPKDGLEPLYGFIDNYLYVGNGRVSAREIIDSGKKGIRLLKNHPSGKMVDKLLEENNSISFTDNAKLIDILKSVLKFTGTVMAIEDRGTAAKTRIVLEKFVNPILDGLKMFDQTTTRSYFAGDRVVIESVIKVVK